MSRRWPRSATLMPDLLAFLFLSLKFCFAFVDCFAFLSCLLKYFETISDLSRWLPQTLASNYYLVGKYCGESHNQFIHWDVSYCLRWFLFCLVDFLSFLCLFQNPYVKHLPQTPVSNYHLWFLLCLVDFLSSLCLLKNPSLKPLPQILASNYHLWIMFCLVDFFSSIYLFQNPLLLAVEVC